MRISLALASWAAVRTVEPPTVIPRLAPVPPPDGNNSVSLWYMWTSAGVTPSSSATIWAKVVSVPCPWGETPLKVEMRPDGSISTLALSERRSP